MNIYIGKQRDMRWLAFALLLLLGLMPWHGAWAQAKSHCNNGSIPGDFMDRVPDTYDSNAQDGQIVWYGKTMNWTLNCGMGQGRAATPGNTTQGAYITLIPFWNGVFGSTSIYAPLDVGAIVNGQLYWLNFGSGMTQMRIGELPPCQDGQICIDRSFSVSEQYVLRYAPTASHGHARTPTLTVCIVTKADNMAIACSSGGTNPGPRYALMPPGGGRPQPGTKTCSFQTNNVTIPLGSYDAASLPAPGQGTRWVDGSLVSAGCTNVTQLNMTFSGAADSDNNTLFQAQGGATGVGIQLQTANGSQIVPNAVKPLSFDAKPAGQSYDFQARYVRTTAPVSPGPGNTHVTVNITYQ